MSTYLHLWDKKIFETDMEEAAARTAEITKVISCFFNSKLFNNKPSPQLLEVLNDSIDEALGVDKKQIARWKWMRLSFRQHQQLSLDTATYRMLRNIDTKLHRADIPTADFHHKDDHLIIYIWLPVQLATPLPNPRRPPKYGDYVIGSLVVSSV